MSCTEIPITSSMMISRKIPITRNTNTQLFESPALGLCVIVMSLTIITVNTNLKAKIVN